MKIEKKYAAMRARDEKWVWCDSLEIANMHAGKLRQETKKFLRGCVDADDFETLVDWFYGKNSYYLTCCDHFVIEFEKDDIGEEFMSEEKYGNHRCGRLISGWLVDTYNFDIQTKVDVTLWLLNHKAITEEQYYAIKSA